MTWTPNHCSGVVGCLESSATIYVLRDPVSGNVRYVGACEAGGNRRRDHRRASGPRGRHLPVEQWKARLAAAGMTAIFEVIDTAGCTGEKARKEREWISHYASECGLSLLNRADNPLWRRCGDYRYRPTSQSPTPTTKN